MSTSETIDSLSRGAASRLEAVSRMADRLQQVTGSAASESNEVTVEVTPAGALVDLQLREGAMRWSTDRLRDEILAACRTATDRAGAAMREVVGDVLPADDLEDLAAGRVPRSTRRHVDEQLRIHRDSEQGR